VTEFRAGCPNLGQGVQKSLLLYIFIFILDFETFSLTPPKEKIDLESLILSHTFFVNNIEPNSVIISDDFSITSTEIPSFRALIHYGLRHKNWTLFLSLHSFYRTSIHNELTLANHFILIKSRVGDIFVKRHKGELFILNGYTNLKLHEYLYVNFKLQYSLAFFIGPNTRGQVIPTRMFTTDTVFTIHQETPRCKVIESDDSDSENEDLNQLSNQTLLEELTLLYPKHHRKIYFIVKNLTINNLLSGSQIELKHKKEVESLHLYDFFSILFNPAPLAAKRLKKQEKKFFKLLFVCSETPWPNYIFPRHLQKLNVR
jgi:hypothetical protein